MTATTATLPRSDAAKALKRARDHLLGLQAPEGWWKGELQTNVTMDAEDLLLRHFLGILKPEQTEEAARWIRSQRRADGTWATFEGGPAELSTTVEAYVALRLAGDAAEAPEMARTAAWVRGHGGVERTRVFTRIWLAVVGAWSWDDLPIIPPEIIQLPSWFPLNPYDWGCWARQTIVPLTIVSHFRPSRPLPFGIGELRTKALPGPRAPWNTLPGAFQRLDVALHAYQRLPHGLKPGRRAALRRATEWIIARQEADGGWGGIQPPLVYSIIALRLMGYPLDHPVIRAAFASIEDFTIREETPGGVVRRLEACQSPVWDTALAVIALADAGVAPDDPALVRAADWLLAEEVTARGDWAVRRPNLRPAGWAFEFANDIYPDTDDSAEVILALRRVKHPDPVRVRAAIERGMTWTRGMRSRDGGWAAFDADNTRTLAEKLPFCDFGAVIDPPSADVTAHVVEMLAAEGEADAADTRDGVRWLLRHQEADGSWFGRWGANHVYGTGGVVPALVEAGLTPDHRAIRRAVAWLKAHQNEDGGWGEDLRSYADPAWVGRGATTPSQTAWALLALLAAGEEHSEEVGRGIDWLVSHQRQDGGWDEPHFTGTGFPGDFYINYHLYRIVFPVTAMGRYLAALEGTKPGGTNQESARWPGAAEPAGDDEGAR